MLRVAALLCLLPLSAQADTVRCGEMRTQADMNACQHMIFAATDARLSAINAAAIARWITPGDRHPAVGLTELDRVLRAQRAWSDYRAAACDADVYLSRGGSEEAMYFYACMDAMTASRIAALTADGQPD